MWNASARAYKGDSVGWGTAGPAPECANEWTAQAYFDGSKYKWGDKMTLADPSGVRTKIFVRDVNRKLLPKWFDSFRSAMRRKITVATTKGMDQDHHVVLANPEDHPTMIRLFFALKVWVLNEGFSLG